MPIYRPDVSPRLNPYGALTDITPEGMEDLFVASKGGLPGLPPLNYRFATGGQYKLRVWFGNTGFPKTMYLYVSDDGGENWEKKDFTFPSNYEVDASSLSIDSQYESDTLYLQTTTLDGVVRPTLEAWVSENNGTTWEHLRTISEPGFVFGADTILHQGNRIFPTGAGLFQVSGLLSLTGPPYETKIVGYQDGAKIVDHTTSPLISNGGISVSVYVKKYETGFFGVDLNSFLGGQEIWRVSSQGVELRGKVPESPLTIPPTDPRPFLQQIWYLPRKGALFIPTLVNQGAKFYTSFDEGATFSEEMGGIRIAIPQITTTGHTGIFQDPISEDEFRNEGFFQDLPSSTFWTDVLSNYADGIEWHIGLEKRLSRRGSKFYLWELISP